MIYGGDFIGYADDHCPIDATGHFRLAHIAWYGTGVMNDFSGELCRIDAPYDHWRNTQLRSRPQSGA